MKIYLQDFLIFNTVFVLDIKTREYLIREKNINENNFINGFYFDFGSNIVGIFCHEKNIFLYYNKIYSHIDSLTVKYHRDKDIAVICFIDSNGKYKITYNFDRPISTLTYTEADEDGDFGLWLYNVINSSERRETFIEFNCGKG